MGANSNARIMAFYHGPPRLKLAPYYFKLNGMYGWSSGWGTDIDQNINKYFSSQKDHWFSKVINQ